MKPSIENLEPGQRRQLRRERLKRKRLKRKRLQKKLIFLAAGLLMLFFFRGVMIHCGFIGKGSGTSHVFENLWDLNDDLLGTVMLDAGHGGNDCGTDVAAVLEKELNLQITLKIQKKLEKKGVRVFMTRKNDTYVSREERVAMAQKENPDLFISIHQNSFTDSSVRGMGIWYNEKKAIGGEESCILAKEIEEKIAADTQIISRGIVPDTDLQVLRQTEVAAVLIEIGYVTNPEDWKLIVSDEYQERVAERIAEAAVAYLMRQNGDELV